MKKINPNYILLFVALLIIASILYLAKINPIPSGIILDRDEIQALQAQIKQHTTTIDYQQTQLDSFAQLKPKFITRRDTIIKRVAFYTQPQISNYFFTLFQDSIKTLEYDSTLYNCFNLEQSKKIVIINEQKIKCDTLLYLTVFESMIKDTIIAEQVEVMQTQDTIMSGQDAIINNLKFKIKKKNRWLFGSIGLNIVQFIFTLFF